MNVPQEILDAIKNNKRILVCGHANPDGDATASCIAMAWALRHLGKDVLLYNKDEFPTYLKFLILPCPLMHSVESLPADPDLIIILDCAEAHRLGEEMEAYIKKIPNINIDHHLGNPNYGSLGNWVDPEAASAGLLVASILESFGIDLVGPLADALYVSITSDTGNFSFGNTSADVLFLAAKLVQNGLSIAPLRQKLDATWSESKWRLWGELRNQVEILEGGKLACIKVSLETLEKYSAKKEDVEGFNEEMRKIKGVRVTCLLREDAKGAEPSTKVSLRSTGTDDVRAVAMQFSGGGHKNAAGASIPLDLEKSFRVLLPYIRHVW